MSHELGLTSPYGSPWVAPVRFWRCEETSLRMVLMPEEKSASSSRIKAEERFSSRTRDQMLACARQQPSSSSRTVGRETL